MNIHMSEIIPEAVMQRAAHIVQEQGLIDFITRQLVREALEPMMPNHHVICVEPVGGTVDTEVVLQFVPKTSPDILHLRVKGY